VDLKEIQEHYRDSATLTLDFKTSEGEGTEQIVLTHLPIDEPLLDELDAMEPDEGDGASVPVRQLVRLAARIKDLTHGGEPVEFTADFWRGLHPSLRQKLIDAVNGNVPREVRYTLALRRLKEQDEKNVEDSNEQA
jgi:hypothetical protein